MNKEHNLANTIATPQTFEFEGREWRLSSMDTIGVLAELERWVVRYAKECLDRGKPSLSPDQDRDGWVAYQEDAEEYNRKRTTGFYRFRNLGFFEATNSAEGSMRLVYYGVRHLHQDWTWGMTERLFEDDEKRAHVMQLVREVNAPKQKSRAANQSSPPATPETK